MPKKPTKQLRAKPAAKTSETRPVLHLWLVKVGWPKSVHLLTRTNRLSEAVAAFGTVHVDKKGKPSELLGTVSFDYQGEVQVPA